MPLNQSKKKKPRFANYLFLILVSTAFFCLLFSTRGFIVDFQSTGNIVFSSLRGGIASFTSHIKRAANSVQELVKLREEYIALTEKLAQYEILERSAAEIRQENYRLREQLELASAIEYEYVFAEITGRDPDNLYQAFSINKGSRHGVEQDMCVVSYQKGAQALVGKVVSAGRDESVVIPIYGERTNVSARFQGARYEGIVQGSGNPNSPLVMRYVARDARAEIKEGDLIVTSGLGGIYPAGIAIGRAAGIYSLEGLYSLGVEVRSSIDFSKLEYVFVLRIEKGAL